MQQEKETCDLAEKFDLVMEKISAALQYIQKDGYGHKEEMVAVSHLSSVLRFIPDFILGKVNFPKTNFKIDLSAFGYEPFGKVDETPPNSYDELELIPVQKFIPEEYLWQFKHLNNWQPPRSFLKKSRACGQVTAEWIASNLSDMPKSWKENHRSLFYFAGSGWENANGERWMCTVGTGTPYPCRMSLHADRLGYHYAQDIVCRV